MAIYTLNSPVVAVVLALTVYVLFTLLLSATRVYGTISELKGSRAGIGECISRGFGQLFPVVAVDLLVASAVAYHDLRIAKDGVGAAEIAAVFD